MKPSYVCCTEVSREANLAGFSLMELLTVLAIISLLAVFAIPALNGINGADGFTQATSNISSALERARAYAMGNSTYVYVGLQEVDGVAPTAANGTGCIVVAVIASQDGTRPYADSPGALTSDVAQINKPLIFAGTHLTGSASLSTSGNMSRPTGATDLSSTTTVTTFQWPLSGTAKYNFTKVIEFDPQGATRLQTAATFTSSIPSYIEIPLVPAHGNTVPVTHSNQAALQIQGITGAVRAYRP